MSAKAGVDRFGLAVHQRVVGGGVVGALGEDLTGAPVDDDAAEQGSRCRTREIDSPAHVQVQVQVQVQEWGLRRHAALSTRVQNAANRSLNASGLS